MPLASRTLSRLVLVGLAACLLLTATGCGDSDASRPENVEVKDPSLVTVQETGDRQFSAILVNNGGKRIAIAQVKVTLYGAGGAKIGTTSIDVEDIPANGEKRFSGGLNIDQEVTRARVQSILVP
jgi:hypothetical protein